MPNTTQCFHMPLGSILLKTLSQNPKLPIAITQNGSDFSIQDFFQKAFSLKNTIEQYPDKTRKWGIYTDSSINGLIAIFGVLWSGNEPVLLTDTCQETLCALNDLVDGFVTDQQDLNNADTVILIDHSILDGDLLWSAKTFLVPELANIYLFTSGSTGKSEMIPKRLRALEMEIYTLEKTFSNFVKDSPALSTVSHQHIYGLLIRMLWPIATNRLIIDGLLRFPQEVSNYLKKYPHACLISSPAFLKRAGHIVEYPKNSKIKTTVFSSGGPLDRTSSLKIQMQGKTSVIEIFGSTETGGIAYREQNTIEKNTPWTPFPRIKVRTHCGVLEIYSPYINDNIWWKTQDMAVITGDHFIIHGRSDRIVKIEEKRIHLDDLENFLETSLLIDEAYTLILDSQKSQLCAVVAPSDTGWHAMSLKGRGAFCKSLQNHLSKKFEVVTFPRKWLFVKQVPTNTQGKREFKTIEDLFIEKEQSTNLLKATKLDSNGTGEKVTISFFVPETLSALKGHFPKQAIVAGVLQIYWVDQFARQEYELDDTTYKLHQIKFKKIMTPNTKYQLNMTWNKIRMSIKYEIKYDENIYASGQLFYNREGA